MSETEAAAPVKIELTRFIPYKRANSRVSLARTYYNIKSNNEGFIVPLFSNATEEEINIFCDMLEDAHFNMPTPDIKKFEYSIFCKKRTDGQPRKPRTCKYFIAVLLDNDEILYFRNADEFADYTGMNKDYIYDALRKPGANNININEKIPRLRIFKHNGEYRIIVSFTKMEITVREKKAIEHYFKYPQTEKLD